MTIHKPQTLGFAPYDGNVIGGALIGLGMALTGACPGTVLVQAGIPVQSGSYALLGGALGGLVYVTIQPSLKHLKQRLRQSAKPELESASSSSCASGTGEGNSRTVLLSSKCKNSPTIHATLNLDPSTVLIAWETMCIAILTLISRYDPSGQQPQLAGLTTPVLGGVAIGAAQAAVILLTRHPVGCSKAYEDMGHYLQSFLLPFSKSSSSASRYLLQPSMFFALGIVSAGAVLGLRFPSLGVMSAEAVKPFTVVLGGAAMTLGARVAGGCTSGHGISGLVTFSFASFVSVAAMFGVGIGTALVLSR